MSKEQNIQIEEYAYSLPDERIAGYPLEKRDDSKLLIYDRGNITETVFNRIAEELPDNTLLIFNNTKVIQARLHFRKETGALIEIFCLEPISPSDYESVFVQTERCTWLCLVGNLKKWKNGDLSRDVALNGKSVRLVASLKEKHETNFSIEFSWNDPTVAFAEILDAAGELPIPPYLNRKTEERDKETYQTVYSKIEGSVAAPTAGLHFTPDVLSELQKHHIKCEELTLHVGAGTFRPVKSKSIGDHEMHAEFFTVKKQFIEQLIMHDGKTVAVGTTSVRTLESLYYIGKMLKEKDASSSLKVDQWIPYGTSDDIPGKEALKIILDHMDKNKLESLTTSTRIMIVPGFRFKIIDGIITNFHQPQSTLLLLVSALLKGNWKAVYDYALSHDFRFLSYGDSSLLWKE